MDTLGSDLATPVVAPNSRERLVQRLGSGLGIACAIHCLATPILIALLPMIGMSWLDPDVGELWMIGGMIATALVGGAWGMKRHGDARIIASFAAGIALIAGAHAFLGHSLAGRILAVGGGLLIAGTHWLSSKLCGSCAADHLGSGEVADGHHCCGDHHDD